MRSIPLVVRSVAVILFCASSAVTAQPALTSMLEDWGSISIYGPAITSSGGGRTEIVEQRTWWDHDSSGNFNVPSDGQLVQNVWTEASVRGGAPVFRSYHDLDGSGLPLFGGQGWTGFRTYATYADTWTITVPHLAAAAILNPVFNFTLTSRLGDLFPPGGSIALPENFYPNNPLWGSVPPGLPVVGPLPTAPPLDLMMSVDSARWYDYQNTQSNTTTVVAMGPGAFAGPLAVENGVPFEVEIRFIAGWRMAHSEIVSLLGSSTERFSTNAVFDAAHTGVLSAVSVYDGTGNLQETWNLTDSQGLAITPVPEPETYVLMLAGLALIGCAGSRHRKAKGSRRDPPAAEVTPDQATSTSW